MKKPVLAINFKNYKEGYGDHGLNICRFASQASREFGIDVIVAPPLLMIPKFIDLCDVIVYSQYADPIGYGAYTGYLPIEALRDLGVKGIIVNHSEKQIEVRDIFKTIQEASRHGIDTLVCVDTPFLGKVIALAGPTAIALEPPELIGTGIAVSRAKPEIIIEGVKSIRSINGDIIVLAGAGISSKEDVNKALELGSDGVLVASAILKSRSPKEVIFSFAEALIKNR